MADDVGATEAVGLNESIVGLTGGPTDDDGRIVLVWEGSRVVSLIINTVDNNVVNVTVCGDGGRGHKRRD